MMQPQPGKTRPISDAERNAERYDILVRELGEASQLLTLDQMDSADQALEKLLPLLTDALDAQRAFLIEASWSDLAPDPVLRVAAVHPPLDVLGRRLPTSPLLTKVLSRSSAVVSDRRKDSGNPLIAGLELLNATAAVLMRIDLGGRVLVIGVCNRKSEYLGPFLSYDRKILGSLVSLFTVGLKLGERRKQELKGLLDSALEIRLEGTLDDILARITASASNAFSSPVSVMLWNSDHSALVIRAGAGLHDSYQKNQAVPLAQVERMLARLGSKTSDVNENLQHSAFGDARLVAREGLHGVLFTLLRINGLFEGVLNVYSREQRHHFSPREFELAGIFAQQVTQVLQNTSMLRQLRVTNTHLKRVNQASRTIVTEMSRGRAELMYGILREAVETITSAVGDRATVGVLLLQSGGSLRFESIYPRHIRPTLAMPPGEVLPLSGMPGQGRSISVRAFLEGSQRVADVRYDPDYVPFCAATRSEIAVPLIDNGKAVGVLNVESDQPDAFDKDDQEALESLAALAVIALRIAGQGQKLRRTSSVALMGAWGAEVTHDINRDVGNLRREIALLRYRPDLPADICEQLDHIDGLADALRQPELPAGDGLETTPRLSHTVVPLDQQIERMWSRLKEKAGPVPLAFEPGSRGAAVDMDHNYLRRILRHLVRNAAEAMKDMPNPPEMPRITIRTLALAECVQVQVDDNGPGLRPDLQRELFGEYELEQDSSGHGLAIVQLLVEVHGGKIELLQRPGPGSCFAFTLKTLAPPRAPG